LGIIATEQAPLAIRREEYLRRHPPDEYNKVDTIRVVCQNMEQTDNAQDTEQPYHPLEETHPFVQWLRTYLLWARFTGVEPAVTTFTGTGVGSVEELLHWRGHHLWIESSLLERIPPRLLAILAVRRYVEQDIWRVHLLAGIVVGLLLMAVMFLALMYVERGLELGTAWHLVNLFLIPVAVELSTGLRERARRAADEATLDRLAEPQMFAQAMEKAIEESYRYGESERTLSRMLKRLNRIRARAGEPPLTLEQIKAQAGEPLFGVEEPTEEEAFMMDTARQEEQR